VMANLWFRNGESIGEVTEIIEFGAIRVNRDSDTHTAFRALVKPGKRIPSLITSITGITQAMVDKDGMPLPQALADFIEFIGNLPLVTYNAEFDIGFLQQAARRQGHHLNNRYTCALKMARAAWPGLPSYKLTDLAKRGNLSEDDTHRAVGDSKRALIIFMSAVEQLGRVSWTAPPSGLAVGKAPMPSRYERILQNEHDVALEGDPAGPLHGEVIVVTGACSIPRLQMADIAARAGCEVRENVTKRTTILVTGTRDLNLYNGKEKSTKLLHAESLIEKGQPIRIVNEEGFMRLVAGCLNEAARRS
jgi:DNA polymerase-3 subunit epsilon